LYKQGHIFNEGLWKTSRHPNLFFELLTWFSFGLSGIRGVWDISAFIGPFVLFMVMDKLTIPITEQYLKRTRAEKYVEYIKQTNKFWPL
jgi:steroid 5-alpha reductase family enzyme